MEDIPVGQFREKIIIQSATVSQDSYGEEVETWSTWATVWAVVIYNTGTEGVHAAQEVAIKDVTFRILYISGVTERMRVKWGNDYYDIKYVTEVGIRKFNELEAVKIDNKT